VVWVFEGWLVWACVGVGLGVVCWWADGLVGEWVSVPVGVLAGGWGAGVAGRVAGVAWGT